MAIVAAHDNAYRVAHELNAAGVNVVVVADIRPASVVSDRAAQAGLNVVNDARIDGTTGNLRVASITITANGRAVKHGCDAVLMAGASRPASISSRNRAAS